jgi:hypothetical protein
MTAARAQFLKAVGMAVLPAPKRAAVRMQARPIKATRTALSMETLGDSMVVVGCGRITI